MKVKELIDKLKELDEDMEVIYDDDGKYVLATDVDIFEGQIVVELNTWSEYKKFALIE